MPTIQRKPPLPALTRDQCRAVDRYAIEELGIPGVVLMENAGRNATDLIEKWARPRLGHRLQRDSADAAEICIVCGKGNNGGDGFVIARHLYIRGFRVSIDLATRADSLTGDAAINHRIAASMGITIRELSNEGTNEETIASAAERWGKSMVVVDALLGTGFVGEVREPLAGIINRINAAAASAEGGPMIVAVDVPSGLDADTGRAGGPAVRAHRTVTFLAGKVGYQNKTAREYLGRVTVVDIGAPLELILNRLKINSSR